MPIVERALVVGGSIAGMSAALCLRKLGAQVELLELDAAWKVAGAGIHLVGASLRAFEDLGLLEQVRAHGYLHGDVQLYPIDGHGGFRLPAKSAATIDGGGGIMRPALHRLLSAATLAAHVDVQLGVKVTELTSSERNVTVERSDGRRGEYDLVVAADGVNSQLRSLLFPDAPRPQYAGQACWRMVTARPAHVDCPTLYVGGPHAVGFIPVSQTQMYMFLLENQPEPMRLESGAAPERLRVLLEGYGGIAASARASIGPDSAIVCRPVESLLLPRPWSSARAVFIGDAAHTTTPQLAMGAALALEDALVLGAELERASDVPAALAAYEARRFERCQLVVENAAQISRYQREGAAPEKAFGVVMASMAQLAQAY